MSGVNDQGVNYACMDQQEREEREAREREEASSETSSGESCIGSYVSYTATPVPFRVRCLDVLKTILAAIAWIIVCLAVVALFLFYGHEIGEVFQVIYLWAIRIIFGIACCIAALILFFFIKSKF